MSNIFKINFSDFIIIYNILDKSTFLNTLIIKINSNFYFLNLLNWVSFILGQKFIFFNLQNFKKIEKSFFGFLNKFIKNKFLYNLDNLYWIELKVVGLGYYFVFDTNYLKIFVGYSHPVYILIPWNLILKTFNNGTLLQIKSFDKHLVGLISSRIRSISSPEIYKGKGIKYAYEVIKLKNIKI
uniref:50S ribosomal protein L6 n=1 Tax=Nephromyces sp. ex Molgula occidentalis TaxID=2544991 RepID=A0A5C1HAK4_9APIC|nr:50S ribosomal protein L6 [Nephromyces sp. ex Molgula occidentalis]